MVCFVKLYAKLQYIAGFCQLSTVLTMLLLILGDILSMKFRILHVEILLAKLNLKSIWVYNLKYIPRLFSEFYPKLILAKIFH